MRVLLRLSPFMVVLLSSGRRSMTISYSILYERGRRDFKHFISKATKRAEWKRGFQAAGLSVKRHICQPQTWSIYLMFYDAASMPQSGGSDSHISPLYRLYAVSLRFDMPKFYISQKHAPERLHFMLYFTFDSTYFKLCKMIKILIKFWRLIWVEHEVKNIPRAQWIFASRGLGPRWRWFATSIWWFYAKMLASELPKEIPPAVIKEISSDTFWLAMAGYEFDIDFHAFSLHYLHALLLII